MSNKLIDKLPSWSALVDILAPIDATLSCEDFQEDEIALYRKFVISVRDLAGDDTPTPGVLQAFKNAFVCDKGLAAVRWGEETELKKYLQQSTMVICGVVRSLQQEFQDNMRDAITYWAMMVVNFMAGLHVNDRLDPVEWGSKQFRVGLAFGALQTGYKLFRDFARHSLSLQDPMQAENLCRHIMILGTSLHGVLEAFQANACLEWLAFYWKLLRNYIVECDRM
jgi:hypothetical protein